MLQIICHKTRVVWRKDPLLFCPKQGLSQTFMAYEPDFMPYVSMGLSLCMPLGVRAICRTCCEVKYRRGSVLDSNSFAWRTVTSSSNLGLGFHSRKRRSETPEYQRQCCIIWTPVVCTLTIARIFSECHNLVAYSESSPEGGPLRSTPPAREAWWRQDKGDRASHWEKI